MKRRTFVLMATVAAALVAWPALSSAEDVKPGTHEGKVIKAGDGKLTMTSKDEQKERTHAVGNDTKITLDGKNAKLEDLKAGFVVKVIAEKKGDEVVITKIEAKIAE